jgi:hypothetical protein
MASEFEPVLISLPDAQRRFWPELSQVPHDFVLYGGTALALRLGVFERFLTYQLSRIQFPKMKQPPIVSEWRLR